jgi:hypothetical protein
MKLISDEMKAREKDNNNSVKRISYDFGSISLTPSQRTVDLTPDRIMLQPCSISDSKVYIDNGNYHITHHNNNIIGGKRLSENNGQREIVISNFEDEPKTAQVNRKKSFSNKNLFKVNYDFTNINNPSPNINIDTNINQNQPYNTYINNIHIDNTSIERTNYINDQNSSADMNDNKNFNYNNKSTIQEETDLNDEVLNYQNARKYMINRSTFIETVSPSENVFKPIITNYIEPPRERIIYVKRQALASSAVRFSNHVQEIHYNYDEVQESYKKEVSTNNKNNTLRDK